MKNTLKKKIITILLVAIIVPLVLVISLLTNSNINDNMELEKKAISVTQNNLQNTIYQSMSEILHYMNIIVQTDILQYDDEKVRKSFDIILGQTDLINRISYSDLNGKELVTTDEYKFDISDTAYFKSSIEGNTFISDAQKNKDTNTQSVNVSIPYERNGKLVGVLVTTINLDSWRELCINAVDNKRIETYIIDSNGIVLATSEDHVKTFDDANNMTIVKNQDIIYGEPIKYTDQNGVEMIAEVELGKRVEIKIVTQEPVDTVMKSLINTIITITFLSILLIIAFVVFAIKLADYITNPIFEIRNKLQSIGEAKIIDDEKLLGRGDELSSLAIGYNEMIETLNANQKELNITLERFTTTQNAGNVGSWDYDVISDTMWIAKNTAKRLGILDAPVNGITLNREQYILMYEKILIITEDGERGIDYFDRNLLNIFGIDLNNLKGKYEIEYSFSSNGENRYSHNAAEPIIENGVLVRLVGVAYDITELKENEKKLINAIDIAEEAMASQSRFVANMSHEIRTPLNAILGYAEISKSFNENDKLDYYLNAIDSSGNILLGIVTDILDFAKVNAGKYNAHYIPCNIGDFLEEIKILFWQKIDMKDLDFELIYDIDTPTLVLPVSIIRQIIINLLGNAIKFTNDGSVAIKAICIEKDGKYNISIDVIDTGIGIADDKKEFVFKEFEQAEESHQKVGTGLGLAISRKFAEVIGANILLESEIGKGSTFTLSMYNIEESQINVESAYNKNEEINFEFISQNVMIVDDIKDNRNVLRAHCDNLQLTPKTYFSAKDALKNLNLFAPDLILTDLRMPEMNGEDFAKLVREQNKDIPILCITASIDPDARYDLQYFDDVLNKPIASSVLAKTMAKYLETAKIGDETTFDIGSAFSNIDLNDHEFKELKDKFYEQIKSLKTGINPKKVKELSIELVEYGEDSGLQILKNIGEALYDASKMIDIVVMMETINNFAKYLEKE